MSATADPLKVRERILLYQSHGLVGQARHALEYLLLNHFRGFRRAEEADFYRYCLVLEQLGELRYTKRLIEDYLVWQVEPEKPITDLGMLLQVILVRVLERLGEGDMALSLAEQTLKAMDSLASGATTEETEEIRLPKGYFPTICSKSIKAALTMTIGEAHLCRDNVILRQRYLNEARELDEFVEEGSVWRCNEKVAQIKGHFDREEYIECIGMILELFREPRRMSGMELASTNEILAACYCQISEPVELFALVGRLMGQRGGEEISVERSPETGERVRVETPSAGHLYIRGLLAQIRGENESARSLFKRATSTDPYHVPSHLALGHSYAAWGDHEQAVACYARIIRKIDESCVAAWVAMAAEYLRVGRLNYAPVYIHEALSLDPDDVGALNELGVYFFARGQLPEAGEALQRALSKCGPLSRPSIVRNLLLVRLKLAVGKRDGAEITRTLAMARQMYVTTPLIVELLAYYAEDPEERRFYLSRAIDGYTARADAHKLRTHIKRLMEMNSILGAL